MTDAHRKIAEKIVAEFYGPLQFVPYHPGTLNANAARLRSIITAALAAQGERLTEPSPVPVAWRVKDYADGWILCHLECDAQHFAQTMSGALIEPLFREAQVWTQKEIEDATREAAEMEAFLKNEPVSPAPPAPADERAKPTLADLQADFRRAQDALARRVLGDPRVGVGTVGADEIEAGAHMEKDDA